MKWRSFSLSEMFHESPVDYLLSVDGKICSFLCLMRLT